MAGAGAVLLPIAVLSRPLRNSMARVVAVRNRGNAMHLASGPNYTEMNFGRRIKSNRIDLMLR
jgi:hypothetical protein